MLVAILSFCLSLISLPVSESRSGRTLTGECSGLLDLMLWFNEEKQILRGELFGGSVIAITEDTITVKKWRGVPRVFRVAPPVASERIPLEWTLGTGHRLRDVRVGDIVGMDLVKVRDGHVCTALGIGRRYGGTIPLAEDEHLPAKTRLHVRCYADQRVEEALIFRLAPWALLHLR